MGVALGLPAGGAAPAMGQLCDERQLAPGPNAMVWKAREGSLSMTRFNFYNCVLSEKKMVLNKKNSAP